MTLVTLAFACLGFLSPANRGALMTCALVAWVLLGAAAGYVSARVYKSFGGRRWKSNILLTSMVCPGYVHTVTPSIYAPTFYCFKRLPGMLGSL